VKPGIDYVSIWSGKGAMPHESGKGWEQKYRPDIAGARREQLLSQKDMQKAKHVLPADTGIGIGSIVNRSVKRCACGRRGLYHRTVCDYCLSAKRRMKRRRAA